MLMLAQLLPWWNWASPKAQSSQGAGTVVRGLVGTLSGFLEIHQQPHTHLQELLRRQVREIFRINLP
jgi:hypothetical protein